MSTPIFSYPQSLLGFTVGNPITLTPVQTGAPTSARLRIETVSGNSDNTNYPSDGLPNVATYKFPNSISVRADGTIAVLDEWSQTVRIISPSGVSSTIAGKYEVINSAVQLGYADGQGSAVRFNTPGALAFDNNGDIIVLDTYNYRIRKVTLSGLVTTIAGSGVNGNLDGTGLNAQFKMLTSLWIDNANNIFVTDASRVRRITPTGVVTTIAGGITNGNVNGIGSVARFREMRGITGDNLGNLYISDDQNNFIRKIDSANNVTTFVNGIATAGIVYDSGLIYVADYRNNQIKTITSTGAINILAGSGVGQFRDGFDTRTGRNAAALFAPEGIAIVSSGTNKIVYVADRNSMRIRKIDLANYTINRQLPNGLTLNPTTGVISGTPTQSIPFIVYTVTASNAFGFTNTILALKID